jgi:hypothetical protein
MENKLKNSERKKADCTKIWGFDQDISHREAQRFTKPPGHDPKYPSKNEKIKEIRKNRKSFINCFGCEIFYDE